MWYRSLLFIVVCLLAAAALVGSLSPVHRPAARRAARRTVDADLQSAVDRLNTSFSRSWNELGLTPAPRASTLTVVRRLSLALAGTVPSLAEIRQLESQPSDGIVAWWLDGQWQDRRTSDYLAERFARAFVGTQDGPFLVFRRRRFVSWLSDEIHANRPYDQIVEQLIATDGLWTSKPAVNFITVTAMPDNDKGPDANLLAARVARGLLAVRLDCAECHAHPFQQWKQKDFQALAGFFAETANSLRGIRDGAKAAEIEDPATGALIPVVASVPFAAEALPEQGASRERLAHWVTDGRNHAFARAAVNRAWAIMFGRPLVEPIDDLPPQGTFPEPLDILADDFTAHGCDLRRLISMIALSDPFQLESRAAIDAAGDGGSLAADEHWSRFPLTRLRPEQVVGSLLQSASLATLDYQSHIILRIARAVGQAEFVRRYGDSGENEFSPQGGTIPQRLVLMNGELVKDKTKENLVGNAATQIAALASTDEKAVEIAYLACLTRRPTQAEQAHFAAELTGTRGTKRRQQMEDIYWALVNSTEFSWNH